MIDNRSYPRDARWLLARLRPEVYADPVGEHEAAVRRAACAEAQARAKIRELELEVATARTAALLDAD